jgi:hypothetical protein
MANPIPTNIFNQAVSPSLDKIFEEQYRLVHLENFEKWVKEAYPEVFKQYGCVVDAGYNDYE